MTREKRKAYPTDVSDEEWSFVAAYLTLMDESAPQRKYELHEMFNALRWMARAGAAWRMLPTNFPPWELVYQQTQRWLAAGCFECMVSDLRSGEDPAQAARAQGIDLQVVKLDEAKRFRTVATAMGSRAQLRMAQPLSTPRT